MMDAIDRKVWNIIRSDTERAYPRTPVEPPEWDPQLCHRCQWCRPKDGQTICDSCVAEVAA